uniref:FBD domain-containing protein n=1 Tax=Heterorhabditis bacteriophora TaxID=37862 RepID=A0A1I7WLW8_HETBA
MLTSLKKICPGQCVTSNISCMKEMMRFSDLRQEMELIHLCALSPHLWDSHIVVRFDSFRKEMEVRDKIVTEEMKRFKRSGPRYTLKLLFVVSWK